VNLVEESFFKAYVFVNLVRAKDIRGTANLRLFNVNLLHNFMTFQIRLHEAILHVCVFVIDEIK